MINMSISTRMMWRSIGVVEGGGVAPLADVIPPISCGAIAFVCCVFGVESKRNAFFFLELSFITLRVEAI